MRYFIKTYGCQMNKADSERIANLLEEQGYAPAPALGEADLLVINTCSVRQASEDKVHGLAPKIKKLRITNNELRAILTGCMVGSATGKRKRVGLKELKARMPWVDEFRTFNDWSRTENLQTRLPAGRAGKEALVPIMEGCDRFCSYCVVPYARGAEKSRPFEEIICEVKELVRRGVKEVTLLGQNVNSYQPSFAELLVALNKIEGLGKIKFLTSNPWDLTDDIIEAMGLAKVERYLHLPVQSGDDEILNRMNRPYTVKQYEELVKKIRRRIRGVRIGTDVIVGFPGETREQFENTVKLFKELKFDNVFVAKYSPRPGTAAAKLPDDVPLAEKKRRHAALLKLFQ